MDISNKLKFPGIGVFIEHKYDLEICELILSYGFSICGVWCSDPIRAKEIASKCSIPVHSSNIDEILVLRDVNIVFVECSPYFVDKIARKSGIGKHFICTMPFGMSSKKALSLIRSTYYPRMLMLFNYLRFLPINKQLQAAIAPDSLGRLFTVDCCIRCSSLLDKGFSWKCEPHMGGGVLNQLACSIIDYVEFMTGLSFSRAFACSRNFRSQTCDISGVRHVRADDFGVVHLESDERTLMNLVVNSLCSCAMFELELVFTGQQGVARLSNFDSLKVERPNEAAAVCVAELEAGNSASHVGALAHERAYFSAVGQLFHLLTTSVHSNDDALHLELPDHCTLCPVNGFLPLCETLDAVKLSAKEKSWVRIERHAQPDTPTEDI